MPALCSEGGAANISRNTGYTSILGEIIQEQGYESICKMCRNVKRLIKHSPGQAILLLPTVASEKDGCGDLSVSIAVFQNLNTKLHGITGN